MDQAATVVSGFEIRGDRFDRAVEP